MAIRKVRIISCKFCECTFTARSTQALWCSPSCRLKHYRRKALAAALQEAKQAAYHERLHNHIKHNMPELHCMFLEGKFK